MRVELTTWMLPTVLSIQLQDLWRCNAVVNEELFGIYMYQTTTPEDVSDIYNTSAGQCVIVQ